MCWSFFREKMCGICIVFFRVGSIKRHFPNPPPPHPPLDPLPNTMSESLEHFAESWDKYDIGEQKRRVLDWVQAEDLESLGRLVQLPASVERASYSGMIVHEAVTNSRLDVIRWAHKSLPLYGDHCLLSTAVSRGNMATAQLICGWFPRDVTQEIMDVAWFRGHNTGDGSIYLWLVGQGHPRSRFA